MVTLTAWEALDDDATADLFNRVYEGYEVPLHVDASTIAFMQATFDLDPARSLVAWQGQRTVGVALLGVRGTQGWVGGMGVETASRRGGIGERLMRALIDNARAAGVRRLWLEVLENNQRAKALYEKLGFRVVRRLSVLALDGACPAPGAPGSACAPRTARARIARERSAPEPWQRGDGTVDHLDVSTPALRAVEIPEGVAVFRVTDGRASVLQMVSASEAAAGRLLDTIRSRAGVTSLRFLNVPEDDAAARALRARGATCQASQYEMALEL